MWLMTIYGFFSVTKSKKDPSKLQIRARKREHLEALIARFDAHFIEPEILTTETSDYRYRVIVEPETWVRVATDLAGEIDWSNFKNEVAKNEQVVGRDYESALHSVWSVMYRLQPKRVYRFDDTDFPLDLFERPEALWDEDLGDDAKERDPYDGFGFGSSRAGRIVRRAQSVPPKRGRGRG